MQILRENGIDWRERRLISKLCMDRRVQVPLDRGKTRNMGILRGGTKTCCISLILFNWYCEYLTKEDGEGFEDFKKREEGGGRERSILHYETKSLLSFGAESFVFQVATQKFKDQDI
jgi:hypothetical protein